MRRYTFLLPVVVFLVLRMTATAQQQPRVRYLFPDVGAPGMNTYVELVAPYDLIGGFGAADGLYGAPTLEVKCFNAADTSKVVISPCVVGWEGRLISCQIFVRPSVTVGSTPIAIPIQVVRVANNATFSSNVDTFFIVQPQTFGAKSGGGMIGSGGSWGARSKRGAMIVDSMVLGSGTYTIDTSDSDPLAGGNQGFLPMVVISRGRIVVASDAVISASAYGKSGGPGGGGGGGYGNSRPASAFPPIPAIPGEADAPLGSGFVGGSSAIPVLGAPGGFGSSSGSGTAALNGVTVSPFSATGRWMSAGPGHPFDNTGESGGGASIGSNTGTPPAFVAVGGGGNATAATGTSIAAVHGKVIGNPQIVPLHGGGGGCGGGAYDSVGGGGGGGIALYSNRAAVISTAESRGGRGHNGTAPGNTLRGDAAAGGAGGCVIIGGRLGVSLGAANVPGGIPGAPVATTNATADTGGVGRFRNDGRLVGSPTVTASAVRWTGPTMDTLTYADSSRWTIRGTGRAGDSILVFVRGETGTWNFGGPFRSFVASDSTWQARITFPFDSVAYVFAIQRCNVPTPNSSTERVPTHIYSQLAASVVRLNLFPALEAPASRQLDTIICPIVRRDTVHLRNRGTGPLVLRSGAFSGTNASLFQIISPALPDTIAPGDSVDVIYSFNGTTGAQGQLGSTLRLQTNDPAAGRNPFDVSVTVVKEQRRFAVRETRISLGGIYVGTGRDTSVVYYNQNSYRDTIVSVTQISGPPIVLQRSPATPAVTRGGDSTVIRFTVMPRDTGAFTILLRITSRPCDRDTVITITGYGRSGVIGSEKGWSVNGISCNDTATQTFGVRNIGNAPLTVEYPTFDPSGSPGFTILSPPQSSFPITIQPGDSIPFRVRAVNAGGGLLLNRIRFLSSDSLAGKNPYFVDLLSERELYSLAAVDTLLDLGTICVGDGPAYKEVRLNNNAQRTPAQLLAIDRADSTTPFQIATPTPTLLPMDIGPREGTAIGVRFTPTQPGIFLDTLFVHANPCNRTFTVIVRGIAVRSTIESSVPTISFGDVRVGTPATKTVVLTNTSTTATPVAVDRLQLRPADPRVRIVWPSIPPPRTLLPGDTIRVTLEYTPDGPGPLPAIDLCAHTSSPCPDEICRPVEGNGIISSIALSRGGLTLAAPPCGGTATVEDTVSIANLGNTPVDITGITAAPAAFAVAPPTSFTLAGGASQTIRVSFTASTGGVTAGTLTIATTDPRRPTITLPLTGRRDSARVSLSTGVMDFDTAYACALPARRTIRIVNDGTIADTIRAAAFPTPFELAPPPPYVIAPGRDTTVTILFNPPTDGRFTGRGVISGGPCGIADTVTLAGIRTTPVYTVDPLDFGDVPIATLATGYAVIHNPTSQTIRVSSATITPSVPSVSIAPGQFPLRIAPRSSANLAVLFAPAAAGNIPAGTTLQVTIDSLCSTVVSTDVAGQGVEGSLISGRGLIGFGKLLWCRAATDSVVIRNAGTAPATIQGFSVDPVGTDLAATSTAGMPTTLPPGDSIVIRATFAPTTGPDGVRVATLRIATDDPKRPEIDVQLRGERISESIAFTGGSFPPATIGAPATTTGWLVNNGTAPVTIATLTLPVPFGITRTRPSLPATLQPGDSITVEMSFTATRAGTTTDSLGVEPAGLCASFPRFGVSATAASTVVATGSWPEVSGRPGELVAIPLTIAENVASAEITSYTIGARFNRTMLIPTRVVLDGTLSEGWSITSRTLEPGLAEFTASGSRPIGGPGTLAVIEARVALGDSITSAIVPTETSRFLSDRATLKVVGGTFRLEGYCTSGDGRIVRDLGTFGLRAVRPNPIGDEATVEIGVVESGRVSLVLADLVGRRSMLLLERELAPGIYTLTVPTVEIASGAYMLELRTPTGREAIPVTIAH